MIALLTSGYLQVRMRSRGICIISRDRQGASSRRGKQEVRVDLDCVALRLCNRRRPHCGLLGDMACTFSMTAHLH